MSATPANSVQTSDPKSDQTSDQRWSIAADHAGFDLKERLRHGLSELTFTDLGAFDTARVDYPDYASQLAKKVASGEFDRGVLICGSGQGMAIAANRIPGVRAALGWNEESVRLARAHNDANVLCLGARLISPELAARLIHLFSQTEFEGGRHTERVEKIEKSTSR